MSTLTFEGKVFKGVQEIGKKLATADLGFQRVLHRVLQCDVQPSGLPGGIIVQTVGELKVDDEEVSGFLRARGWRVPAAVARLCLAEAIADMGLTLCTQRPLKFTQLFHLLPEAPNSKSYYVHNDLFRLVYG